MAWTKILVGEWIELRDGYDIKSKIHFTMAGITSIG